MPQATRMLIGLGAGLLLAALASATWAQELPAGIAVQATDRGEVYVDGTGRTLYFLGRDDKPGVSACTATQYKEGTDGFRGVKHPLMRLDARPTCLDKSQPVVPQAGAVAVGQWKILERPDGIRQWLYDGRPVYRSIKDRVPGEVNGAFGAPLYVPVERPPTVTIRRPGSGGAYFIGANSRPVLIREKDCRDACGGTEPFVAPELANALGSWSISATKEGRRQWARGGQPLYLGGDGLVRNIDAKSWKVASLARPAAVPTDLATIVTIPGRSGDGRIVTTKAGATVYAFSCQEDGPDRLDCDDPADRSPLWTTLCGGTERCARLFRPVTPSRGARGDGKVWSIVTIDTPWAPVRSADDKGAIKVWAYRGRPLFTYAGDHRPGDTNGELGYQNRAWTAVDAPEF